MEVCLDGQHWLSPDAALRVSQPEDAPDGAQQPTATSAGESKDSSEGRDADTKGEDEGKAGGDDSDAGGSAARDDEARAAGDGSRVAVRTTVVTSTSALDLTTPAAEGVMPEKKGKFGRSFSFLDPSPPSAPEETEEPEAEWDPPTLELIASAVSAGAHHSAAVSRQGELFTWGCSTGGRLGLPMDRVAYVKGRQVQGVALRHVKRPARVGRLAHRPVTMVACSSDGTAAFAPAMLRAVAPARVPNTGGARLLLCGPGLVGLALGRGQEPVADDAHSDARATDAAGNWPDHSDSQ